uniref:TIGR03032 family protein n=1 Tax=Rhabditophanes sp. KR3021 TaxID=114890 RepID=A0AC35TJ95_9BILA
MIIFPPNKDFAGARLNKIGLDGHNLFIAPSRSKFIEIWHVHVLIPNSWNQVVKINLTECFVKRYCLDKVDDFIYCFVIGILNGNDRPEVMMLKIDINKQDTFESFTLAESSGGEFDAHVFIDNIQLATSGGKVYMYDSTIIRGFIPYWEVQLNENKTFDIKSLLIGDDLYEQNKKYIACRFPIILNAEKRQIARFINSDELLVFNESLNVWQTYTVSTQNDLDLRWINNKGLTESYGRQGHRVKAVESPLQLVSDGQMVIANVLYNGKYRMFRLIIDEQAKTYSFKFLSSIAVSEGYFKMFYMAVSEDKMAFICDQSITICPLVPLTLKEAAFWQIQRINCIIDSEGRYVGGISEKDIKNCVGFKGQRSLV